MKKIWDCIINGLLSIAELEDVSVNSKERDRVRKTVFYYFIDKDDTLKEKSKLIKFNGAILSCLVDAMPYPADFASWLPMQNVPPVL